MFGKNRKRARKIMDAYGPLVGQSIPDTGFSPSLEKAVSGLLTDLRHFATRRGVNFQTVLKASKTAFDAGCPGANATR